MERLKKFRKKSRPARDAARTYFTGKCHVCKQQNVTVSNLNCNRHNYCQLCASFVPRFIKGDFTCKMCLPAQTTRTSTKTSLYRVMDDLRIGNSQSTVKSTSSDPSPQQEFDNSDLDGNNDELDKLLAPFIPCDQPHQQVENMAPIPKKTSFLHLTLPSAYPEKELRPIKDNNMGRLAFNNYINGLIERSRDPQPPNDMSQRTPSPPFSSMQMNKPLLSRPHRNSSKFKVSEKFQMDPYEEERGSSPCKGIRPRSADSTDFDNLLELIGDFEGPDMTSHSSSRSESSLSLNSDHPLIATADDFWRD